MRLLVTGSAGFIGANLVLRPLEGKGPSTIVGFDNLNDYYGPSLKERRLRHIEATAAGFKSKSFIALKEQKIKGIAEISLLDLCLARRKKTKSSKGVIVLVRSTS